MSLYLWLVRLSLLYCQLGIYCTLFGPVARILDEEGGSFLIIKLSEAASNKARIPLSSPHKPLEKRSIRE